MIVYTKSISSIKDYERGIEEARIREGLPENCPGCGRNEAYWRHGSYQRQVRRSGLKKVPVRVLRYICKFCSLTISCLYKFIVAYRQYGIKAIAAVIESYVQEATSYRETAWSQAEGGACVATGFRWVSEVCGKTELLLNMMQREMVMTGVWQEDLPVELACPNAGKAASGEKSRSLDKLAGLVETAGKWLGNIPSAVICLHEHMALEAETCLSIIAGHKLRLSAPQKMQHLNF